MTTKEVERVAFSPNEVSRALGLSLNHTYDLLKQGVIPNVRLGKRILVPKADLDALLKTGVPGDR